MNCPNTVRIGEKNQSPFELCSKQHEKYEFLLHCLTCLSMKGFHTLSCLVIIQVLAGKSAFESRWTIFAFMTYCALPLGPWKYFHIQSCFAQAARSPYHVILTFLHRKLAECTRSCEKRCYCWRYVAKSFRWNMAVSRVLILYYSVRARADVKLDYPGMFYYFHTGRFCSGYGRCRRDVRGC
jgi:hypothetical protein